MLQGKNLLKNSQAGLTEQDFVKAVYILFSLSVDPGEASVH